MGQSHSSHCLSSQQGVAIAWVTSEGVGAPGLISIAGTIQITLAGAITDVPKQHVRGSAKYRQRPFRMELVSGRGDRPLSFPS
jgi:hypothetical protein